MKLFVLINLLKSSSCLKNNPFVLSFSTLLNKVESGNSLERYGKACEELPNVANRFCDNLRNADRNAQRIMAIKAERTAKLERERLFRIKDAKRRKDNIIKLALGK